MNMLQEFASPMTLGLLAVAAAFLVIAFTKWLWTNLKMPGPWGVPLLGYYPFLEENVGRQFRRLTKKYGEVFIVNIAGQYFLHLGSVKALKEAHVNKAEDFPSRGKKFSASRFIMGESLAFIDGDQWRVQRKFFVQSMREVGLTPNSEELQEPVAEAVRYVLKELQKSRGDVVNISTLLYTACGNAVRLLFLGNRVSDGTAAKLNDAFLKMMTPMTPVNMILVGTLARYAILTRKPEFRSIIEGKNEMISLLYQILDDHKLRFDANHEPTDFIDLYLRERHLREKKSDSLAKHFTDKSLIHSLIQVYGDGSTSIAFTIAYFVRWLSRRPDVQQDLYQEVVGVVGTERLPNWADRVNLPLMNSALKEMIRTMDVALIFPDMECTRDTTVLGVHVPKGTITILNFEALLKDPEVYKDPDTVDITRFLPGKTKTDPPVAFGIGKRACAGEALVMTEYFSFLSALAQNFFFEKSSDEVNDLYSFGHEIKLKVIPRPTGLYGIPTEIS